jgi:cellulose synthase/poly-beta-1,6-N-acetylglucosamine synthase-like glycosyltransferase
MLLTLVFWFASIAVIYPYTIYPLLLRVLVTAWPVRAAPRTAGSALPSVTLIVSAYNEVNAIGQKLHNTLALDYPSASLQIIVASDASSDGTDEIVRQIAAAEPRLLLIRQNERRGKSAALNLAVAAARGEIIVFSDANAMYERSAIRELVAGFADPGVGYVVGAALYTDADGHAAAENESAYWRLELHLKRLESAFGCVVGGDGAIYAVRRGLYVNLRDDDISDFVNPMQVVAAGYRGVFVPAARCYESAGDTVAKEFRRKRRIVNRSWRAVRRYAARLSLGKHARFLFMLWSHKVLRWWALPLILLAWLANAALLERSWLYVCTWSLINLSLCAALLGALAGRGNRRPSRALSLAYYFYAINLAGFLGIWDEYRGLRHVTWDHVRKTPG